MDTGLATAGAVIGTILALLEQLQALVDSGEDPEQLTSVVQTLGLQRCSFEDTIIKLLCDVIPSADLAAFFKAPEHARWREAPVQAKANERLGQFAEEYWQTCEFIQKLLQDIKQDADKVLFQDHIVGFIRFSITISKIDLRDRPDVQSAVLLTFPQTENGYTKVMGRKEHECPKGSREKEWGAQDDLE